MANDRAPQEQGKERDEKGRFLPGCNGRFHPGQSGNPGGRPKGLSITAEMNRLLQEAANLEKPLKRSKKKLRLLVEGIFLAATKGDASLAKEIWNRLDGKVPDKLEHTGAEGGPVKIEDARQSLLDRVNSVAARGGKAKDNSGPSAE